MHQNPHIVHFQPKYTNKAFDSVPRTMLIQKTNRTNINTHYGNGCLTSLQVNMLTLSTTAHHPPTDVASMEFRKCLYSHRSFSSFSCKKYPIQHTQIQTYYLTRMTLPSSLNTQTHTSPPPTYMNTLPHWNSGFSQTNESPPQNPHSL